MGFIEGQFGVFGSTHPTEPLRSKNSLSANAGESFLSFNLIEKNLPDEKYPRSRDAKRTRDEFTKAKRATVTQ